MMKSFLFVALVSLFILSPAALFGQKSGEIDASLVVRQELDQNGFCLAVFGVCDGLRSVEKMEGGEIALWGLGSFTRSSGKLILPLSQTTLAIVDTNDPNLKVVVGPDNNLHGQLADSVLVVTNPGPDMEKDVIFWLLQGKARKP